MSDVIQDGVEDAFRECGTNLHTFDYFRELERQSGRKSSVRRELISRVADFKPDLLHLQIQHTDIIDGKTIGTIKQRFPNIKISNWTGDVRNYVPKTYQKIAKYADYNLISSTGQIDEFRRTIKKDIHFWQIGYNPKLYYPPSSNPKRKCEYDVIFIANNNTIEGYPGRVERERTCKMLRKEFGSKFKLYGTGWPKSLRSSGSMHQRKLAKEYHKSYCALSVSHYNELNHYFSDRLLMCLACGRPTVSLRFPGWESYFADNCDLVIANSIAEIPGKIKYLKENPELANYIGENGARKVRAEHTYLSRVKELLEIVGLSHKV